MASKQYQIVLTMNAKQVENYLKTLKHRASEVRKEMDDMVLENGTPRDADKYGQLAKELRILEDSIHATTTELRDYRDVVKDLSGSKLYELRRALKQVKREMEKVSEKDTSRLAELQEDYRKIDDQIKKITGNYKKQGNVISQVAKRLSAYVLIYSGFNVVKDKLGEVLKMNLALSDSLADIRKTTGLANNEVEALANSLLKLDTRTTAEELNQLAYEAGRMGVGKFGVEGVEGFVRAANQIKVALGEDLGEESIQQVYKLADVMGVIPTLGVEGSLLSIGSALNELTQTGTSSGEFIVDFTSRMAGIARQANLTTAEVTAFGSALDEMGQEVEVSATSMNKFVMQMFTHYSLVAKAAGMAPEALKSMLEAGKTADAIVAVMEGLSDRGGLSQLAPLFKDLGSDGARLSQTLAAMASNVDKVKSSLEVARRAFNEARSVTNEYNIKNETTAALLERIKNSWTELFVNSKNKGAIHEFIKDLKDMSDSLQESPYFINSLALAFQALTLAVKALIALIPALLTFAGLWTVFNTLKVTIIGLRYAGVGLVVALDLMRAGFMKLIGQEVTLTAATLRLATAWKGLNTAMKANIIMAVVSLVAMLVTSLVDLNDEMEETSDAFAEMDKDYKKYLGNLQQARRETDMLFRVLRDENASKDKRAEAIRILNEKYADYLPNLISEKDSIDKIKAAQDELNTSMAQGLALRAKQASSRKILEPYYEKLGVAMDKRENIHNLAVEQDSSDPNMTAQYPTSLLYQDVVDAFDRGMTQDEIIGYVVGEAQKATGYDMKKWSYEQNQWAYRQAQLEVKDTVEALTELLTVSKRQDEIWDGIIGDYIPKSNGTKIVEDDKKEKEKAAREAEQKAKEHYEAVMDNIREYFEIQVDALNDLFSSGKITEEYLERKKSDLKKNKNISMSMADQSIVSGDVRTWNTFKKSIPSNSTLKGLDASILPNFEEYQQRSAKAFTRIITADLKDMSVKLNKFGEGFIDELAAKGAKRKREASDVDVSHQKEVNRIMMENLFKEQTARDFRKKAETVGVMQAALPEGPAESASEKMKESWSDAIDYIRKKYEELFGINIDTTEGQMAFRKLMEPLEKDFPQLIAMDKEKLKTLYNMMLDFHDSDLEAERKASNRDERTMKFGFSKTYFSQKNSDMQDDLESRGKWMKVMGSVGLSTDSLMADNEVELYRRKLEAAEAYYEYVKYMGAEEAVQKKAQQQLDQATMDLTEKLVAQVETHLAYLKEYGGAIEDFGTDFGEAIFGSLSDRQQAIEDLGKSFAKTTQKILLDWVKQRMMQKLQNKLMEKEEERHLSNMEGKEEQSLNFREFISAIFGKTRVKTEEKVSSEVSQKHEEATSKDVATTAKGAQANASLNAAEGASKTIAKLGWWGIPLVAVITALINGLIGMAMSKVTALFGSSAGGDAGKIAAPKTKLVSGMLTYDEGNVQQVARYMGDDGVIYTVTKSVDELDTGMVNTPIATRVNGTPALVGEKGPEMVIGRETTAALMVSRPDLLRDIIRFDRYHSGRGYRTYDAGNVGDFSDGMPIDEQSSKMMQALQDLTAVNAALTAQLQRGIRAHIAKYGPGGIADEVVDALDFKMRQGNDEKLKRLFRR